MTPLEFGQHILKKIEEAALNPPDTGCCAGGSPVALPSQRFVQIGTPVTVACEELVIAVTDVSEYDLGEHCCPGQTATYSVAMGRDCAGVTMHDDGTNNVQGIVDVSERQERDGELFWNVAHCMVDFYLTRSFSLNYTVQGGLAITTMQLTVGVP